MWIVKLFFFLMLPLAIFVNFLSVSKDYDVKRKYSRREIGV